MKIKIRAVVAAAALSCFAFCSHAQVVTVTDAQGVIYDIVAGTRTVNVSSANQNYFNTKAVDIVIPARVVDVSTTAVSADPYDVVGLADGAFRNTIITSVTIEAPVTAIPTEAFAGCQRLATATLPVTVTAVGRKAFYNAPALTDVAGLTAVTSIGNEAFKDCASLDGFTLPATLTTMGEAAFENCTSLSRADIPASLGTVAKRAFNGCTSLVSLTTHAGTTDIGDEAFKGCTALVNPVLTDGLTGIGEYAFCGCKSIGTLNLPAGVNVSRFAFTSAAIDDIVWPAEAITIQLGAFQNVSRLTKLEIPSYIQTIPSACFRECKQLEEVNFASGVATIGDAAFYDCSSLTAITLPQTVRRIESNAFSNCSQLTDFDFPDNMDYLGYTCFANCSSLEHLRLPAGAELWNEVFSGTRLKSITFPTEPMGTIGDNPFGNNQTIESVTIPGWMKRVVPGMFRGCANLNEVIIEEGVEELARQSFDGCKSLTQITFPASLRTIGQSAFESSLSLTVAHFNDGLLTIGQDAFKKSALTDVVIPASVNSMAMSVFSENQAMKTVTFAEGSALKEIPENCFLNNSALTTVNFAEGLETIGKQAFRGCYALKDVTLPLSLKAIKTYAFHLCRAFGPLSLHPGLFTDDCAFEDAGVTVINLPDQPCSFGRNVFRNNPHITEFTFPEWMDTVPAGFCHSWQQLLTVQLPPAAKAIGEEAFYFCTSLHDVEFPETLELLDRRCFAACIGTSPKFGAVTLSEGCVVGDQAFFNSTVTQIIFRGCAEFRTNVFEAVTTIESIEFPECMSEIPDGFCKDWTSLTEVKLPSTLTRIGASAFENCQKLTSIDLSGFDQLQAIGTLAFSRSGITGLVWPDHKIDFGENLFHKSSLKAVEIPHWLDSIPTGFCRDCPLLAEVTWQERTDTDNGDILIGDYAFSACALTSLTLPDLDKVSLGRAAFASNAQLQTIDWGTGLITLGDEAFQWTGLTEVTIPDCVTVVPQSCFTNCRNLTTVDLGQGVTAIGSSAFSSCKISSVTWSPAIETLGNDCFYQNNLSTLHIPATVRTIESSVFAYNGNLESVTIDDGPQMLGGGAFTNCGKLPEIAIPGSVKWIGNGCFGGCTSLSKVTFDEGLERIDWGAFSGTPVERLVFPSTLRQVNLEAFQSCRQLKYVEFNSESLEIGKQAFRYDDALELVVSNGNIDNFGQHCFFGCTSLAAFDYRGTRPINTISDYAFENCTSLRRFPYLDEANFGDGIFKGCSSFEQLIFPATGEYYNRWGVYSPFDYAYNTPALQSLVWPSADPRVRLRYNDIASAPLEALSYNYATDILLPHTGDNRCTIHDYDANGQPSDTDPAKSILMVTRGEKWKYVEAGYAKRFTIVEMKEPQFNIEGGIYSQFDPDKNVNHYKATLRWRVPLSDLNPDGDTRVTISRDDVQIAEVIFSKPAEPVYNDHYKTTVTAVDVKMRRAGEEEFRPTAFTGDFYFPVTQPDGSVIYEMQYNVTESTMYFDTESSKRLVAFDKYGYTSWFTMVDEFDSPRLDSGNVPMSYAYSAKMDAYVYSVPVNNDNLTVGDDGLRYHYEARSTADMEDGYCLMYTAMAMPTLSGDGIYTYDQIAADTEGRLRATNAQNIRLSYAIDPDLVSQRGLVNGQLVWMANSVQTYCVVGDDDRRLAGETQLNGAQATGQAQVSAEYAFAPGRQYQTIVNSLFRGSFGSPTLTVPGAPALTGEVHARLHPHFLEDPKAHPEVAFMTEITLRPDATDTGYPDGHTLDDGEWHLGLWRRLTWTDVEGSNIKDYFDPHPDMQDYHLIHHIGGRADNIGTPRCPSCSHDYVPSDSRQKAPVVRSQAQTVNISDSFVAKELTANTIDYKARAYVKVPSTMLPGEPLYMLADVPLTDSGDHTVTGVEEVDSDLGVSDAVWYDLQGVRVLHPEPGRIYIRVTPEGSSLSVKR